MSRRKNTSRKGYSFERELKNQLRDAGVEMRRQPGSGAVGTRANESRLQGDGLIDPFGWAKKVECKFYENPPNFKRLEEHRKTEVLYVDTPAGRFVWTTTDFFAEQLGRAYTNPGVVPHDFSILKTGSAFKQFDAWMKGCDLLAVKKNLCGSCVWMPYALWLDLIACAAQGAFMDQEEPAAPELREALERISRLGNDGKLSLEDYVRRADEIAVDALVSAEAAE